jgi:hypothetical protein
MYLKSRCTRVNGSSLMYADAQKTCIHVLVFLLTVLPLCFSAYGQSPNSESPVTLSELRRMAGKGNTETDRKLAVECRNLAKKHFEDGDYPTALSLFHEAAALGDAGAQGVLGSMYHQGVPAAGITQNYAEAARWYRKSAEQGHSFAQHYLGKLYNNGDGVPQSFAEAAKWFELAAQNGHVASQVQIGLKLQFGEGVEQNFSTAANWFRRAADQGNADAQHNLSFLYLQGQGVPQDYVEAHKWINIASSLAKGADHNKFVETRNLLSKMMTAQQIAEAQRLAREWRPVTPEYNGQRPPK